MNRPSSVHEQLPDHELVAEVTRLAASEQQATATLVSALAELDARRLYLGQGCSSMFTYCTQVLHLAEHAAFNRIEAARAARRFPIILDLLAEGHVHVSAVRLLAPHLTASNHRDVLLQASRKSKREIEEIVARLQPKLDVPPSVRKLPSPPTSNPLPTPRPVADHSQPSGIVANSIAGKTPAHARVEPLAPGRYKMQFNVTRDTYEKLRRVQDLLRHRVPNGDPAVVIDRALTLLLESLEKQKAAATEQPRRGEPTRKHSRHVPANVRREVWRRDAGRCRFQGPAGQCQETGFLEFHHVVPFASGGFLKSCSGRNDTRFVADVPAERIPPDLRMPNSSFVAVVVGRDLVRVEAFGHARIEIEDRIRAVLNSEWDPIGVAHAVDDEYDGYLADILSLLERNTSVEMLVAHLMSIEGEHMGLRGSPRGKLLRVAEALRTLRLPWSR